MSLAGLSLAKLLEPVPLGIALGLCIGKPLGILGATMIAVISGLAPRPEGASWAGLIGIGMLAFNDPTHAAQLRLGVLAGSLLAAAAGYLILRLTAPALRESPG